MAPKHIHHLIVMGDSLSDRGTMEKRKLLNCLSLARFSGLSKYSPLGRFTNGFTWNDHLCAMIANRFIVKILKRKYKIDAADIADAIVHQDRKIYDYIKESFSLQNDQSVLFDGGDLLRNYAVGGACAVAPTRQLSKGPSRLLASLMLTSISHQRQKLFAYDDSHQVTAEAKAHTLVIEWSGANDFVTVNVKPTLAIVEAVIEARIHNVKMMAAKGYQHFILFNMPDLSFTPHFQRRQHKQGYISTYCSFLNDKLKYEIRLLGEEYPHINIDIFDTDGLFTQVFNNPIRYGFVKEKKTNEYTKSKEFHINQDGTSIAYGHMFWDSLHPTTHLHALLAENFMQHYKHQYAFLEPNKLGAVDSMCQFNVLN